MGSTPPIRCLNPLCSIPKAIGLKVRGSSLVTQCKTMRPVCDVSRHGLRFPGAQAGHSAPTRMQRIWPTMLQARGSVLSVPPFSAGGLSSPGTQRGCAIASAPRSQRCPRPLAGGVRSSRTPPRDSTEVHGWSQLFDSNTGARPVRVAPRPRGLQPCTHHPCTAAKLPTTLCAAATAIPSPPLRSHPNGVGGGELASFTAAGSLLPLSIEAISAG